VLLCEKVFSETLKTAHSPKSPLMQEILKLRNKKYKNKHNSSELHDTTIQRTGKQY
jgi:hypothetical protein